MIVPWSGKKYVGGFRNDKANGYGKQFGPNELLMYEGEFKDGKYDGYGRYFGGNGLLQYEGLWKNGKYDGFGEEFWRDDRDIKAPMYKGGFKDSEFDGFGLLISHPDDGRIHINGKFKDGDLQGPAVIYDNNHRVIHKGEFDSKPWLEVIEEYIELSKKKKKSTKKKSSIKGR